MYLQKALTVIAAGELYADLIMSGFDFWPAPGHEAFAREFHREIGGGAAITACGLARLGTRTGLLGVVGEDGEWLTGQLRKHRVDVSDVRTDALEPTGFTVAVTSPADRAFFTYLGANRGFPAALAEAAAAKQLAGVRHVHLAFAPELDTAAALFLAIRGNGCTISLDVGWHEDWLADPQALAALRWIDIFFPNETEAARLTGEADPEQCLKRLSEAGLKRVALKLGDRGAALLWDGRIFFEAAHTVTPLDTTGAGDSFDAGFLYAWLKGKRGEESLRTANICGALSTEKHGGISGFPDAVSLRALVDA
jgi:sugar/nucleoside kinase (ribokinase family)